MKYIKKILNYIRKPYKIITFLDIRKIIRVSDETFLKLKYRETINKKLNLNNPKGFNEKIQWLKLNDRRPEYIKMVDKYEVKKYVSELIGNEHIIPTIGIYNKFTDINIKELPNQFVIKCTHDSGSTIVCKNKEEFDFKVAEKKINKALKVNYYRLAREWPYKNIKPRIIVEQYMEEEGKKDLTDYKFMCFNGKVKCSFVCLNRNTKGGLNVDFYDLNWNKMPFERHYKNSDIILKKPKNYEKMIKLAEKLARNIPFVRVDFYEIKNRIYFGELTFYPGAGFEEFNPEEYDEILGSWINLPAKKEKKNER